MLTQESAARKDRFQPHAPKFQHRHYAEIARIIRTLPDSDRDWIAEDFADQLSNTNPRFNRQRFLDACQP